MSINEDFQGYRDVAKAEATGDTQEKKTRTRLTEEQRIEKTRAGWEKKLGEKEAEIARLSGEVALLKKALGRAE